MDTPWLLLVLAVSVLVSLVLLAVVCLDCWSKGPLVSIRQTSASEEYMHSTEFRVIHPLQPPGDLTSIRSAPHLLSLPRASSTSEPGTQRQHRSFTPTETDSNPSYENPAEGPEYVNPDQNLADSDVEDPGYIIVIPDDESRASSGSGAQPVYVNLAEEECREYLNVVPPPPKNYAPAASLPSTRSDTEDDGEDDSDDEANYVNQPPMIHSTP